uniref:Aladin seven-bladed propeller domain-containing protein n=1 Tax=Branchiostoma floridae TaxID=7739 RepID=C3ZHQ1_BRAFL|eukprot:XP_002592035.1 hypothetical protein BRAFLDRAFT_79624 [Branchiostoma floridae]
MSSLSMFPSPPPVGFMSVCEASGELVAAKLGEEGMVQTQYCGQLSNEDMIATFAENADWYHSAIRAFCWHPHIHKFAVALRDNSIKVYSRTSKIVPLLKHKVQKGVSALAWEPQCASVLAVGCQNCVLIWHVDPMSLSSRPSTTTCQVLSRPGHSPITCLAWSPHGKLLASASPADTAMMVCPIPFTYTFYSVLFLGICVHQT